MCAPCGRKSAICFIIVGIVVLVAGLLISGFIHAQVEAGLLKIFVYKYDSKFDDPNYEDCKNETNTFYFHNLTNADAFLAGLEKANFEQVGPYEYTSSVCKFGVTVQGDLEFYHEYRTEPTLNTENGVSEADLITTINPGYLGIMRAFSPYGDNPEYLFEGVFLGGFLGGVIGGMQSPDFIQGVLKAGTPYPFGIEQHLFLNERRNVMLALKGATQGALSLTNNQFYTQWADGGLFELDFNGDGNTPDLELVGSGGTPTGINNTVAANLWDSTNAHSLTNSASGSALWFQAASNNTIKSQLATEFGLNSSQVDTVVSWHTAFKDGVVPVLVMSQFGVDSLDQLAFRQWGEGDVLGGASIADVSPVPIPGAPEFAMFASDFSIPLRFNASFSEWLLSNNETGLFDGMNILTLLGMVQSNNAVGLSAYFKLSVPEASVLAFYIDTMISDIVDLIMLGTFMEGSGPIVTGIPKELLWNRTDPLLVLIKQDPHVGLMYQDQMWKTKEEAKEDLKNQTIYRGGSKDDLLYFLQQHTFKGDTVVHEWKEDVTVSGYRGMGLLPGASSKLDSWDLWIGGAVRAVTLQKNGTIDVYGITLDRYDIDPAAWESAAENPDNAKYYQTIGGFWNMSTNNPLDLFLSRPHWAGADADIKDNVTGLEEVDYDYNFFLAVEPQSGITMKAHNVVGVSFHYPNLDRFFPGMGGWGIFPVMWTDVDVGVSEKDAKAFKSALAAAKMATVVALIFGIVVGLLFILGGVITFITWYRRSRTTYVKPVEE